MRKDKDFLANKRRQEDLRQMTDPARWPKLGVLPVKMRTHKPGETPECGFLRCWDKVEPIVYRENIYSVAEKYPSAMGKGFVDLSKVPQTKYKDFDALVAEWTVD